MEDLAAADFTAFFRDIHDCEPFPWQQRLTEQVLGQGAWPKVIDLPTGVGKTAVLDTAVFALAARPSLSPRRVVFVIDRRIVVDQVFERAKRIKRRIEAGKTSVLQGVRDRLRELSGGEPLGVAALRGGIPIDNEWTHRPDQPWVMVSTVDQFGSRLLFRGYGVSAGMRPIHAGLAGNDCLVILDEVHLSVPFAETLAQVAALEVGGLPRRFEVVEMSATPSDRSAERFKLDPVGDLEDCAELRQRVGAAKAAAVESVRTPDALPAAVVRIIGAIAKSNAAEGVHSVGVVVNRVRIARETYRALVEGGYKTFLITGRMRPLDRVELIEKIKPAVDPDGDRRGDVLTVIVATQAIEVGADFSFDAMITESAPVDSLRQRFGRLDRRGRLGARSGRAAKAWILGPKSTLTSKKADPIYGYAAKLTWEELLRRADNGPIDVSPGSLADYPSGTTAPRARGPLLLQTHMDAWVQTSPEPIVQPSVEWFLHGIEDDKKANPDVSILWRWDRSPEALRLVPPRQAELLQVPIDAAKSWLSGGKEVEIADAALVTAEEGGFSSCDVGADWVRIDRVPERVRVEEIRPGDVLVVDPRRGGLEAGTWDPSSTNPVDDLGDAAQMAYGRRATLRLDRRILGSVPPLPSEEALADASARERILHWLENWRTEQDERPSWLSEALVRLGRGFDITRVYPEDGEGYYVLIQRHAETGRPMVDPSMMDGSDETGSLTGTGITLRLHLEGVGERAGKIAERLGLPSELARDLCLAGRLHDVGKVDQRFQAQLVGGDPVALETQKEPLAKSLPGAGRIWRYPTGMRHEVMSVAMAESNPELLASAQDKDLVLHLVGTHHGWGRPLPPIVNDPAPRMLSYPIDGHILASDSDLVDSPLALDMADRFWRLVERYGYYGLAWLETILRLADHQQSAEEVSRS